MEERKIFKTLYIIIISFITLAVLGMLGLSGYAIATEGSEQWYVILIMGAIFLSMLGVLYFISIFIYRDAPKYNMDRWMWMFLAIFIPNAIGLLLYFIMRKERKGIRKSACVNCGGAVNEEFNVCPYCGVDVKARCFNCGEKVSSNWNVCPKCGEKVNK